MTRANRRIINPQHFGIDLADVRIRINPEIPIRIPDPILALVGFAVFDCSYNYYYAYPIAVTVEKPCGSLSICLLDSFL